jgi:hypothetical protein
VFRLASYGPLPDFGSFGATTADVDTDDIDADDSVDIV